MYSINAISQTNFKSLQKKSINGVKAINQEPQTKTQQPTQDTVSFKGMATKPVLLKQPTSMTKFYATILGLFGLGSLAYKSHRKSIETQNSELTTQVEKLMLETEKLSETIENTNQTLKETRLHLLNTLGINEIEEKNNKLSFTYKDTPFVMELENVEDPYQTLSEIMINREKNDDIVIYNPNATDLPSASTAEIVNYKSTFREKLPESPGAVSLRDAFSDALWNRDYGDKYHIVCTFKYNGETHEVVKTSLFNYSQEYMLASFKEKIQTMIDNSAKENSKDVFVKLLQNK